jgi:hypothetical protein
VAEERAGRVSQIDSTGQITPVVDGLNSPEGIAFDDTGNLYVVEDVEDGRLIQVDPAGSRSTLASGLEAPEGVAWTPDGTLYVTESNSQYADSPLDLRTHVTRVSPGGQVSRIITDTPVISGLMMAAWSYAGISPGSDGRLYVTNELSGQENTRTVVLIPGILTATMTLSTTDSVFVVDPQAGERTLLASNLVSPEGLRFLSSGGPAASGLFARDGSLSPAGPLSAGFPLYVVEEDIGDGRGRLSVIGEDGHHSPLCTGFMTVEDVALDARGRLYVSEDESGLIVRIEPSQIGPNAVTIGGPQEAIVQQDTTFSATVSPITTTPPLTYTWEASEHAPHGVIGSLSSRAVFSWSTPGPRWITVIATNVGGTVTGTHPVAVVTPPQLDRSTFLPLILRLDGARQGSIEPR